MLKEGMFIQDRYEIISKIGSGGMADVYKAKDHTLNRFVAVKVLKPEFRKDKGFITKFRVEAQSAAGLAHPNIVNVYDVGEDNGISFIVMELVEGITLKEYIEKKLSAEAEGIIEGRTLYVYNQQKEKLYLTDDAKGFHITCAMPIFAEGDVIGCVAAVASPEGKGDTVGAETEVKLIQTAAGFLGKQLEP